MGGLAARSIATAPEFRGRRQSARIIQLERTRRSDEPGWRVVDLVAAARGVSARQLLHPSRCTMDVAAARQLAMYLMHVTLQRTYIEVGRFFGRDRTTVTYACARIEDQRDRDPLEAEIAALEAALAEADGEGEGQRHATG